MKQNTYDVVIVGGGIAGGALSTVILELQDGYTDQVRGEMLSPWGIFEVHKMGLDDALYAANPSPLLRWVQWDEVYSDQTEAPLIDLTRSFVPGVGAPLSISHFRTCESFVSHAIAAGSVVHFGTKGSNTPPLRA
jgi:flavin-dependent dehydrogenase